MRLVESDAKALLAEYGLGAPQGRACDSAEQARAAASEIAAPVYVKAQIPYGDRATLGLVQRAEDPEAAAAIAGELLGRSVDGNVVVAVLVEAAVEAAVSAYVSVHVEDEVHARVLRIGVGGGAGYDAGAAEIELALPSRGLEMHELRRRVAALELSSGDREALTRGAMAVVRAAREWHAYTVEVNPLFVVDGRPLAVDAKVELDPYSLPTVPRPELLPEQAESPREREARLFQQRDHRGSFRYVQLVEDDDADGLPLVGSHAVGGGESLVVFDALDAVGLRPANYCDTSGAPSREKVAFAAQLIASQPHIKGYFFSSCIANQPLSVTANGLTDGLEAAGWRGATVVRIAGNEEPIAREIIERWAAEHGVPAKVVGRELHEWQAAELLAEVLAENGGQG